MSTQHFFYDSADRRWEILLNVSSADRVLAATKLDLLPPQHDYSDAISLIFGTRKLSATLWALIEPQAAEQNVGEESFKDSLDGESLAGGWHCLLSAVETHLESLSPELGRAFNSQVDATAKLIELGTNQIIRRLDDPEERDKLLATLGDES